MRWPNVRKVSRMEKEPSLLHPTICTKPTPAAATRSKLQCRNWGQTAGCLTSDTNSTLSRTYAWYFALAVSQAMTESIPSQQNSRTCVKDSFRSERIHGTLLDPDLSPGTCKKWANLRSGGRLTRTHKTQADLRWRFSADSR